MKTDRIFVLLLVVMLPLSGCFDDAVGDAEGADDTTSGSTVINHYNNTTVINHHYHNNSTTTSVLEIKTLYVPDNTSANITTVNGEVVEILDIWVMMNGHVRDYAVYVNGYFTCSTHTETQELSGVGQFSTYPEMGYDWLPTDGTSCVYEFDGIGADLYIIYRIN